MGDKKDRIELNEDELFEVSGGTNVGIPGRNIRGSGKSKVYCKKCNGYVDVAESDSGGRTKCIKGHFVDEL